MSTSAYPYTCVLLDVDGTLVDSGPVIIDALEHALKTMGVDVPPIDELSKYVGPPLWVSFPLLGVPDDQVNEAVAQYRAYYKHICLTPPVYPGMVALIKDLHAAGIALGTATSKQEHMAKDQMEHLGLASYFTEIIGATPDPHCDKSAVVQDALNRLEAKGADISRAVIVGDRHYDLNGAKATGIDSIGVAWGYAEPGELDPATHVVQDVDALRVLLLG